MLRLAFEAGPGLPQQSWAGRDTVVVQGRNSSQRELLPKGASGAGMAALLLSLAWLPWALSSSGKMVQAARLRLPVVGDNGSLSLTACTPRQGVGPATVALACLWACGSGQGQESSESPAHSEGGKGWEVVQVGPSPAMAQEWPPVDLEASHCSS